MVSYWDTSSPKAKEGSVLILVVVDYGLVLSIFQLNPLYSLVLILVVVDYGLVHVTDYSRT